MDQLYFTFHNILILCLSSILTFYFLKNRSLELILLGIAVLFPVTVLFVVLTLGAFNVLHNGLVSCVLLLLLIICVKPLFDSRRGNILPPKNYSLWLIMLLLVVGGILTGHIAGRYVFTGTHFIFDDFSYHATATGHWLKDHSIWSGPFNYHYHNPMNAEVLSFWWMLPFERDGFVFLTGLYWLFLTCLAIFILCGQLGLPLAIRFLILLTVFVSRHVFQQGASTFSGVDLAGPAMVLAALAFFSFRHTQKQSSDQPLLVLAGLACGFAVGSKVPFATVAGLLVFWIFAAGPKSYPFSKRLKEVVYFSFSVLATGLFWYGKNIYLTGNPVFPGQLGPFEGPLTSDIQYSTKIIGLLIESGFKPALACELFQKHLNWPLPMALLSLTGYLGSFVCLLFCKNVSGDVKRNGLLLLLTGFVMLATYINMPFSGRYNTPDSPMSLSPRFVIGPFLVGLVLYSFLINLPNKIKWIFRGLFFAAVATALYETGFILTYGVTVLLLAAAIVAGKMGSIEIPLQKILLYMNMLCAGALLGLSINITVQQKKTDNNVFRYRNDDILIGQCWKQLETFPSGTISASLGPDSYQCYPLLGRRYQHQYRVLNNDGCIRERWYQRYQEDPVNAIWWPSRPRRIPNPDSYLKNAAQVGINSLLMTCYDDGVWPISSEDLTDAGWQCVWETKRTMIWKGAQ